MRRDYTMSSMLRLPVLAETSQLSLVKTQVHMSYSSYNLTSIGHWCILIEHWCILIDSLLKRALTRYLQVTNRLLTEAKSAEHRLTEGAEPERSVAPNRFFKDGVSDIGKSLTHTPLHRPHRTPTHPQPTVHTPPVHPTSSHSTQIPIAELN